MLPTISWITKEGIKTAKEIALLGACPVETKRAQGCFYFEAFAVGAKMMTIKGKFLAWDSSSGDLGHQESEGQDKCVSNWSRGTGSTLGWENDPCSGATQLSVV